MSRLALLGLVHLGLNLFNSEPVHQLDSFARPGRILFRSRRLADVYHGDIIVVEGPPRLRLGLRSIDVDLGVGKRPLVPYIGQDALGLLAEAAGLASEQGDSARLQQTTGCKHGKRMPKRA